MPGRQVRHAKPEAGDTPGPEYALDRDRGLGLTGPRPESRRADINDHRQATVQCSGNLRKHGFPQFPGSH